MAKHPSLNLPFERPPQLNPRRKMGRNDLCWCGSQKKWKKCHKNREEQTPIEIGALKARMHAESNKGICLHPEASSTTCSEKVVRSHTLQRKGGLSAIFEKGRGISGKVGFQRILENKGRIIPGVVGVRSASTFMGFCNKHDTEMFRPVETGVVQLTDEVCFLLSYRALAYEYFQKQNALESDNIMREMDRGKSFEIQCAIQERINIVHQGQLRGMQDLESWKEQYDEAFMKKDFGIYGSYSVSFTGILPLVACGAFHPEFDFQGRPLQKLGRGALEYEYIAFNLTVLDGRTVAVLSWRGGNQGPAWDFAKSLKDVPPTEKAKSIARLAFEHLENTYMNPAWWNELPESLREAAIKRMKSGLPEDPRHSDCLKSNEYDLLFDDEISEENFRG